MCWAGGMERHFVTQVGTYNFCKCIIKNVQQSAVSCCCCCCFFHPGSYEQHIWIDCVHVLFCKPELFLHADCMKLLYFIVQCSLRQSNPPKRSLVSALRGQRTHFRVIVVWESPGQTPYEMNFPFFFLVNHRIFSFLSGMNSILVYVGSEILGNYFPFSWTVSGHMQHADLLAMNLVGTTVWLVISYYLYCFKFFVKI